MTSRKILTGLTVQNPGSRIAGLDMVRAAAILMVLNSHCGDVFCAWLGLHSYVGSSQTGFLGVELFFVLSGFLIGRLLIDIVDEGVTARGWWIFMVRRWLRTLPLYFLCLLVLSLFWRPYFWVPGYARLLHALPYFATLTQNLAWPMVENWFGVSWSLSVEEWFYLLYSALLFACAARLRPAVAFWFSIAIFLVLPMYLRWRLPAGVDFDEILSKEVIYRLDAIGFGVVVAWLSVRHPRLLRPARLFLVAGILIELYLWLMAQASVRMPFSIHARNTIFYDLVSLGFALMLPACATTRRFGPIGWAAGALSRQSYALYLIHLPVLEMIGAYRPILHLSAPLAILVSVAVIWGLAYLSARWFEGPILRLRPPQHKPPIPAPA